MSHVRLYFDFISPYAYLAVTQLDGFARRTGAVIELVPVVYGAILDATGLVGPMESPSKRRYAFRDALRCADRLGVPLAGPPAHPFRSLEALRTVCLYREHRDVGRLVQRLMHRCWGEGAPLTELEVLEEAVTGTGLDVTDLRQRITAAAVKQQLAELTQDALDRGVFGVPTFEIESELFWGHDRMDDLVERLAGREPPAADQLAAMLARPRGIDRKGAPRTGG